ncbi:MAG: NADH-quinone oxidoreductase subunit C [Cytophagales bacterium]|nr:NADH-quinone oxidoreductase subunit C [Cytophagales bacterium]
MNFTEITSHLSSRGYTFEIVESNVLMPYIILPKEQLTAVCETLFSDPRFYFDYLSCITALDLGVEAAKFEIAYNLYSIIHHQSLCVKVVLDRPTDERLPCIDTISHIWKSALWHEREAYDMYGIVFTHHPDLRRILNPADWVGHPLRKDYVANVEYHGVRVPY